MLNHAPSHDRPRPPVAAAVILAPPPSLQVASKPRLPPCQSESAPPNPAPAGGRMKRKLCCAHEQGGARIREPAGGDRLPNNDPSTRLSRRAKAHAPPPIQLFSQACRVGESVRMCSCLLPVLHSKNTESGGLVHVSNHSRTDSFGGRGANPPLGASAQAHCAQAVFKLQHSREERTLPPLDRMRMLGHVPKTRFPLLRLRDRDSSLSSPHPPGLVVKAASFERAGKAVGEGGASGYSLHGYGKERRWRPQLKKRRR